MELSGSKTEKNLLIAFLQESQDRNSFTFFSKTAEKEGYHQISEVLSTIADHDRIHAKKFFQFLPGGDYEIKSTFSPGGIHTTEENLKYAANSKTEKNVKMYEEFGQVAREEGFEEIARLFLNTVVAEKTHDKIIRKFLKCIEAGTVWNRDEPVNWFCIKCGFAIEGNEPPAMCPACNHPKEYFMVFDENFLGL